MRTIKYQAWIGHTMIQVTKMDFMKDSFGEYNGFIEGYYLTGEQKGTHTSNPTKSTILREYTGLKDKNGKDIYEGDIVKFSDWKPKEVFWEGNNGLAGFRLKNTDLFLMGYESDRYEIIGNIYDNPELLEGNTP